MEVVQRQMQKMLLFREVFYLFICLFFLKKETETQQLVMSGSPCDGSVAVTPPCCCVRCRLSRARFMSEVFRSSFVRCHVPASPSPQNAESAAPLFSSHCSLSLFTLPSSFIFFLSSLKIWPAVVIFLVHTQLEN